MKNNIPLLNALLKYRRENNIPYSMPGNKGGDAFERDAIGKEFKDNLGRLDITEVDPLDNLHAPEGVIKEAQELLANYYGVKKGFFLVNGSSGGNLAAIFSAFNEGDEVLVERNCHRSIYNALILRKLKVTYIKGSTLKDTELFLPPSEGDILEAYRRNSNAKGIILTYPNYFGIGYDLEKTIIKLRNMNLKVILDEAHGAHFGVSPKLPKNLAVLADYTVISAHKTLPALTGSSYLLVNDDNSNCEYYVSAFMTTSPSYLMMASLDYARHYIESYGKVDYDVLIDLVEEMKVRINSLKKVKVLEDKDLPPNYYLDKSRYIILLGKGYSGEKLLKYLRNNNIQGEMSFQRGVVLLLSPCKAKENLDYLYKVLQDLEMESIKEERLMVDWLYYNKEPKKILECYEVLNMNYIEIPLKKAINKISKEAIVPYPPGIPILLPGESFDGNIIEALEEHQRRGLSVLGVKNGAVKVLL